MLHRRGGSALCGDEWILNGLNQRSTQWDFLFNSNIERKIIFSRTRQICFKHLLAIMNDGHYFMNCRLIVWQDGEDVWNKLWNFEPGVCALAPAPGELRGRWGGNICRPPASCDKHRKLKYLNCELKFSFWKNDVDYYISEKYFFVIPWVPATWESWNNKRAISQPGLLAGAWTC